VDLRGALRGVPAIPSWLVSSIARCAREARGHGIDQAGLGSARATDVVHRRL